MPTTPKKDPVKKASTTTIRKAPTSKAKSTAARKSKPKLVTLDGLPIMRINYKGKNLYAVTAASRIARFRTNSAFKGLSLVCDDPLMNEGWTQSLVTARVMDGDTIKAKVTVMGSMAVDGASFLSTAMTRAQSKVLASMGIGIAVAPEVQQMIGNLEVADMEAIMSAQENSAKGKAEVNKRLGNPGDAENIQSLTQGL